MSLRDQVADGVFTGIRGPRPLPFPLGIVCFFGSIPSVSGIDINAWAQILAVASQVHKDYLDHLLTLGPVTWRWSGVILRGLSARLACPRRLSCSHGPHIPDVHYAGIGTVVENADRDVRL